MNMEKLIEEYPIKIIHEINTINNINDSVEEILIINLDTDIVRRTYIRLLMKKLGISYRLIIVKKPSLNLYNSVRTYQKHIANNSNPIKPMSIGESGCYLSQMWCLNYIIKNNIKNAIIFEDDIVIHKSWRELFAQAKFQSYDFLMLGAADHGFNKGNKQLIKNGIYIPKHHVIMGTHAIYYSHHGATKIFQHRIQIPEYFDRTMMNFFKLFDSTKCGVCSPNIFTVENSTTNLSNNFGISKYKYNDYYYRECYGQDFNFKDYYFIYLDLFVKAVMLNIDKYRNLDANRFMRLLLMNYFNNESRLCDYHITKLDTQFFSISDFFNLITSIKQYHPYEQLFYNHHFEFCKKHTITPAELMRNPDFYNKYRDQYWNQNNNELFHKQNLDLKRPIPSYEVIKELEQELEHNHIAHLHCYNLSNFYNIYGEYLQRIIEFASKVIITFSIEDNDTIINSREFTLLKVPNYGYDIGAKFSAIQYLCDTKQEYDYILFLHSKSCEHTRKIYFNSLINNLPFIGEKLNNNNNNIIGGFFPPTIHQGNNIPIIYNNKYLYEKDLSNCLYYESTNNKLYVDGVIKYLYKDDEPCSNCTIWPSGNCYILHRYIAEKLFRDTALYGCFNSVEDFDYNWVRLFYRIPHESVKFVYEYYRMNGLYGNNQEFRKASNGKHGIPDMMVEHAFERIVFRVIGKQKMRLQILPNEKNREEILSLSDKISDVFQMR